MKHSNRQAGSTILETVFYVTFFAILSLAVINAIIAMTKSFQETSLQAELQESGNILERMSREIKQAQSSTLNSTSDITLNTLDQSGNPKTVEFQLSGTDLRLLENGALTGNLNVSDISVNSLQFTSITTTAGSAVRIVMTVSSKSDTSGRTANFYDTLVLRGDYGN